MKNENSSIKKRKHLLAFTLVTALNVALGIFLINTSFGQTSENKYKNQPSLKVEVTTQTDSPLLISMISVDNTAESYQIINYTVQNVSSKKVKAYVLVYTDETGASKVSTSLFQSFVSEQIIQSSNVEERVNVKLNGKIFLSLDYVKFDDGGSWGKDSEKQSEYISGHDEGQKSAVKQIKDWLINQNKNAVSNLLEQQIDEINPPVVDKKETEKWQRGVKSGYRSVLFRLKTEYEDKGLEAVSQKLEQIEKLTKMEEK